MSCTGCFWAEEGECLQGEDTTQENCPIYASRIDAMTGQPLGPLHPAPEPTPEQLLMASVSRHDRGVED
jgi:nitrite reductase/ring-hydroxylating ferredoxin subunit